MQQFVYSREEKRKAVIRAIYGSFIFLAQYLWSGKKDLFFTPFSWVHKAVQDMVINSKKRIKIIALPRGFGKTKLLSVLYVVWSIFVRKRSYVILLSFSQKKSKQNLRDIKRLLNNKKFRAMFKWKRGAFWGAEAIEIVMANGRTVLIEAKGGMQTILGSSEGQARPDLILMDDIEDLKLVKNIDRIEALQEWLFTEVIPALSPADSYGRPGEIIYIGTPLNADCLFARAMRWSEDCDVIVYGALTHDDKSIWEERFSTESLMKERAGYMERGMMHVWNSQFMCRPDSKSTLKFDPEKMMAFGIKEKQELLRKKAYEKIVITVDMAYTQKDYSDPIGITVCGHNTGSMFDTLECHQEIWTQEELYFKLLEIEKSYSNFEKVATYCESLVYDVIKSLFQQLNITYNKNLDIHKVKRPKGHYTDSKNQRIGQLVPYYNSGLWRICVKDCKPLTPQLGSWDSKSTLPTDDAIDSQSMQVSHVIVGARPKKKQDDVENEAGRHIAAMLKKHEDKTRMLLEKDLEYDDISTMFHM